MSFGDTKYDTVFLLAFFNGFFTRFKTMVFQPFRQFFLGHADKFFNGFTVDDDLRFRSDGNGIVDHTSDRKFTGGVGDNISFLHLIAVDFFPFSRFKSEFFQKLQEDFFGVAEPFGDFHRFWMDRITVIIGQIDVSVQFLTVS